MTYCDIIKTTHEPYGYCFGCIVEKIKHICYTYWLIFSSRSQHQWGTNGGKCGVCGDPYDGKRENEAGGKYATGTIVATYRAGDVIAVTV